MIKESRVLTVLVWCAIVTFWALFFVGLYVLGNRDNARSEAYNKGLTMVEKECENKNSLEASYEAKDWYDLYHDNGPREVPVCRKPLNKTEVDEVNRQRSFREQLRNGDIDADTLDENCYSPNICQ